MRNQIKAEFPIGNINITRELYDPITATVLAVGALGMGAYSAVEQKKAAKDAAKAQQQAEMDARRIAAEKKPMEESATTLVDTGVFGADTSSLGLTVEPTEAKKKVTGLGTASAATGLGFGA